MRKHLTDYGVWMVALLLALSFPLSSLYHIADDLEAARRLHLFAKYVLVATGFGLAVWVCPPHRVAVRLLLGIFFLSEFWDGMQYAVCRLASAKDTTEALAQAWNTGVPKAMCTRVFGFDEVIWFLTWPLIIQIGLLLTMATWVIWAWKRSQVG